MKYIYIIQLLSTYRFTFRVACFGRSERSGSRTIVVVGRRARRCWTNRSHHCSMVFIHFVLLDAYLHMFDSNDMNYFFQKKNKTKQNKTKQNKIINNFKFKNQFQTQNINNNEPKKKFKKKS